MIFKKFELNFFIREQTNKVEEFLGGNRAGAYFFYLGFARGTDAELEIGGGNCQPIAFRFTQEVRKDRDRRLAFDDALREIKLLEQVELLYAEFHQVQPLAFCFLRLL